MDDLCSLVAFAVEVLVKNAQVVAAAFGVPGDGMAARQVGNTNIQSAVLSTILTTILVGIIAIIFYLFVEASSSGLMFRNYVIAVVVVLGIVMSIVSGWLMARIANRNFGFVNGDILGATNEISRVIILFVTAFVLGAIAL